MRTIVEDLNNSPPPKKKLNVSSPFDENPNQTLNEFSPHYAKQATQLAENSKVPVDYISIKDIIASKLFFYPIEDIHIRPFNAKEVILVNYAHESESSRPLAQAINSAIYEDFNCLDLTFSDVKQIMCWLRLNSFIKTKWKLKVICVNDDHQKSIVKEEATVDSLINEITVYNTDFLINYMDTEKASIAYDAMALEYGLTFVPLTFRMHIELEELYESLLTKNDDGSYNESSLTSEHRNTLFIADYAKFLAPCHGDTLQEKIEFFKLLELPADIYKDIKDFEEATSHNIVEQVVNTCKECGGEIVTNLSITPRSFFP